MEIRLSQKTNHIGSSLHLLQKFVFLTCHHLKSFCVVGVDIQLPEDASVVHTSPSPHVHP